MNDITHRQIDTLIHFGAGSCQELETHLARQPTRLLLVEADPELAAALRSRTAELAQVRVIETAVAAQPGPVVLRRYNLAAANGLHSVTGLREFYPGLKPRPSLELEAITPASLLDSLALNADGAHSLMLDLPGDEFTVLQALLTSGHLRQFEEIQLYCGLVPLYENSVPAETIIEWLREQGFDCVRKEDGDHPHRPCWMLKRNPLCLTIDQLRQQLEHFTATDAALRQDKDYLIKQHQALQTERDEQAKLALTRQAEIEKLKAQLQEQQKRVAQFDSQVSEQEQRQSLMNEELHKAEGQIELIKELLLRPDLLSSPDQKSPGVLKESGTL